jgi:hypothetical protein
MRIRTTVTLLGITVLAGCSPERPTSHAAAARPASEQVVPAVKATPPPPPPRKVFVDFSANNPKSGAKNWPKPGQPDYQKVLFARNLKSNDGGEQFPDVFDEATTFYVADHGDGVRVYVGRRIAKTQFFPEFCEVTSADTPPTFDGVAWETCEFLHEAAPAAVPNPATGPVETGNAP